MLYLRLFYRLMIRPLLHESVRSGLAVTAIALGVAVVLAIDLGGAAAIGSFRSSMESLVGDTNLEITATGGVPENVLGKLAALPYAVEFFPQMEDYAVVTDTRQTMSLLGLDLVAEASGHADSPSISKWVGSNTLRDLKDYGSVWVGQSSQRNIGDRIALLINGRVGEYTIRGLFPDANGSAPAVVMDLAAAQYALNRSGVVDGILVRVPATADLQEWQRRLQTVLPTGADVRPSGASTVENQRMLAAFRWNLRLLSYIALVVGAFLIYNTISVSVVRRRAEIGIVRALGAGRAMILAGFLGEAAILGLAGSLLGLPLGRLMATGAVKMMAATVQSLYVSSRPGPLTLTASAAVMALILGICVSVASAYPAAREASLVAPIEAMARGRREYVAHLHKGRDLSLALAIAGFAALASRAPAIGGIPWLGYLAGLLLVIASALALPAFVAVTMRLLSWTAARWVGVEALLASRSLTASLRRTSVLVGALSTAIAMMVSVGIMVGSFRQTVLVWMEDKLPADLYVGPAGALAVDRHPTLSVDLAEKIARLPGVAAIHRRRDYEIRYQGMPAGLGSIELNVLAGYRKSDFVSGRPIEKLVSELRDTNAILVSEPFANKHHVDIGDAITLPLAGERPTFRVVDVFYDYSSERGEILMPRDRLLHYLPDPAPTDVAVYLAPGAGLEQVRAEIENVAAGWRLFVVSNRDLRQETLRIFDRTFAITYALEAVAIFVAVIGMAGALFALVIDRRRELGLLRFLGAARSQIRKLILIEAGFLGLLATWMGIALGFAMSFILIFVINKQSFGWTIQFHWPIKVLLAALSIVYVATILAGLYPATVAVRLRPIEVVHEE